MFDNFPQDWEAKKLEDVCDILDRHRVPLNSTDRATRQGKIPYWGANGIVDYIDQAIFDEPLLLMPEDGGPFSEARDKPICHLLDGPAWVNNHAHVLKAVNALREYVYYWFVNRDITPFLKGGGRAKLNQADMRKLPILIPPLPEQQRIAEILSSVDESIRATEAVIAQAERVKRGLMEDLLTGGLGSAAIANGEVPEGWHPVKLASVVLNKTSKWKENADNIPYIGLEHILQEAGALCGVGDSSDVVSAKNTFESGDVLFGKLRPNLKKYWHASFCGICSTDILVLRAGKNIRSDFLFVIVQSNHFLDLAISDAVGTKMPRTSWSRLGEFNLLLPPLHEQQRIAEMHASMDDQIITNHAAVEQLKRLKRGLMDDLLTGRVRTVA